MNVCTNLPGAVPISPLLCAVNFFHEKYICSACHLIIEWTKLNSISVLL
jgi:hypothetical protein